MKFKSKGIYWIAAAAMVLALYLLLNPPAPALGASYGRDVNRFGPDSVDMQMANGNLQTDAPYMMAPPKPALKTLLLFPPSQTDLEKLSGPPAKIQ
jgi:hypothetical protein